MLAERDSSLSLHAINIDQVRPDIPEGANIEKAHQEEVVNQPPPPPAAEHPSSGDDETSFNMRARYGQKRNYLPVCCYGLLVKERTNLFLQSSLWCSKFSFSSYIWRIVS